MITRRNFALASAAAPLAAVGCTSVEAPSEPAAPMTTMTLSIHQNTARPAGYRGSLEGWARAGIKNVELNDGLLTAFLETDTLAAAKQILTDNDLTPVSAVVSAQDLWLPGPEHENALVTWRTRCEQYKELGLQRIYSPSGTNRPVTLEDFAATPDCIREAGEIAAEFDLIGMIEFTRNSSHLATLGSALKVIHEADHPNIRPMLDFFHFWSGLSKFEDLDMIKQGELEHCHFQDLLDAPRELTDNSYRVIPGNGVTPIAKIIHKLSEKGFAGALSVELFRQEIVNGDPFEVATEIRTKCERVMGEAGVA
jgi:sugar phosphate isomerase/epimerase